MSSPPRFLPVPSLILNRWLIPIVAAWSVLGCAIVAFAQGPPSGFEPFPPIDQASFDLGATADTAAPEAGVEDRIKTLEEELKKLQDAEQKKKDDDAKRPNSKITLELQADAYMFDQDPQNMAAIVAGAPIGDIQDGSAFRRARFGWTGDYSVMEYRIEFDFANAGRPSFLDVWGNVKDLPLVNNIRVGHFFEPFSLERLTSNRFSTFMERSLIDSSFVPARNMGVMAFDWSENESMTWALGIFRTESDNFGDDAGDNGERSATGRVTWLPYYDELSGGRYYLHFGGAYSFRDANGDLVRYRTQPESRLGATTPNVPAFVDTGAIAANSSQLFGLEGAWINGPFSLQSEYVFAPADRIGGPDPDFSGWYVNASYFLTGEHRPYRRRYGTMDRVTPFEDFFRVRTPRGICTGLGAWELATRLSQADLDDAGVRGGSLMDYTVGLNWYLNPYTRVQFNWIHAFLDNPTNGHSDADIFGTRFQFDF